MPVGKNKKKSLGGVPRRALKSNKKAPVKKSGLTKPSSKLRSSVAARKKTASRVKRG